MNRLVLKKKKPNLIWRRVFRILGVLLAPFAVKFGVLSFDALIRILPLERKRNYLLFVFFICDRRGLYRVISCRRKSDAAAAAAEYCFHVKHKSLKVEKHALAGYRFCIETGFFEAALVFRIFYYRTRLLNEGITETEMSDIAFEVAIIGFENYIDIARIHSFDKSFLYCIRDKISRFEKYFEYGLSHLVASSFLKGDPDSNACVELFSRDDRDRESRLSSLKGVDVILIGPSVYESFMPGLDFENVLVARVGYSGVESLSSEKNTGTDVSLYKRHKIRSMKLLGKVGYIQELDLCYLSEVQQSDVIELVGDPRIVISVFQGKVLGGCSVNAGLELILNLIYDGALRVHLKNVDLFTGRFYPKGYITYNGKYGSSSSSIELDDAKMCRSFVHHSPIAHYGLYHWLWRHGKTLGDDVFEDLMSDGLLGYLRKLECQYNPVKG